MQVWELRWADVAPATHVFDYAVVADAIAAVVRREQGRRRNRTEVFAEIDRILVAAFGDWVRAWSWAASSGGPVRPFCCTTHSVLPDRDQDPELTITRVRDSVLDLRAFLLEIEALIDESRAANGSPLDAPSEAVERAAPRILEIVATRTNGEDSWYSTFERAMSWFAETVVYDVVAAQNLVDAAIRGRFESWTLPTADATRAAFAHLVTGIGAADSSTIDGLAAWTAIRAGAFEKLPTTPTRRPVTVDGHDLYIQSIELDRDPERADRMVSALALCRDAASHDLPLAFDQLAEWQAQVLGESTPVEFRAGDAFAKGGRERYPIGMLTAAKFERALAGANDRTLPVAMRAARAYLDVCFYHPFPDGNARAARLALDHVLTREGLALHDARGIFTLSRAAGDARGAWSLAAAIDRLAGPRVNR